MSNIGTDFGFIPSTIYVNGNQTRKMEKVKLTEDENGLGCPFDVSFFVVIFFPPENSRSLNSRIDV